MCRYSTSNDNVASQLQPDNSLKPTLSPNTSVKLPISGSYIDTRPIDIMFSAVNMHIQCHITLKFTDTNKKMIDTTSFSLQIIQLNLTGMFPKEFLELFMVLKKVTIVNISPNLTKATHYQSCIMKSPQKIESFQV